MECYAAYCNCCKKWQPVAVVKNKRSKHVRAYCLGCFNWIRSDNADDKAELRKRGATK